MTFYPSMKTGGGTVEMADENALGEPNTYAHQRLATDPTVPTKTREALDIPFTGHRHWATRENQVAYERYMEGLQGKPGLRVFTYDSAEQNNYQYIVVEVDESVFGATRDDVVALLHRHNVIARKYFWPGVHRFEPYRSEQPRAAETLPTTERIAPRVMVLPTGPQMSAVDVGAVCEIIFSASR